MIDPSRLQRAYETARRDLLDERTEAGHWVGELSGSALSTATATSALSVVADRLGQSHRETPRLRSLVSRGIGRLIRDQNPDGGWGDTDKSHSNIATTMLAQAAFHLAGAAESHADLLTKAERYVDSQGGIEGLRKRYGRDKTFAVPILTNAALAGRVPWREVSPLPFELACLPHGFYRFLRLPVVSYAIPALVAIGQARYFHRKPRNPLVRLVRRAAVEKSLATLRRMQPSSGGFLEATPLTSFVVMSLASIGREAHPVVREGVAFLIRSIREDDSWPIDTNLGTWATTLSINALAGPGEDIEGCDGPGLLGCLPWLLACQHTEVHPFTNAASGGWGWTDLSGAVPDADDTAGALLALAAIRPFTPPEQQGPIDSAARGGVSWLLGLQNANGGWPTFCRGWGRLPFDRSAVDLTAHALRALQKWLALLSQEESTPSSEGEVVWPARSISALNRAIERGFGYLARSQRADGSWVPLWFGNQNHPEEENPVYGTARVLQAYRDFGWLDEPAAGQGVDWLVAAQKADGGWGGGRGIEGTASGSAEVSSVEETALAVESLLGARYHPAARGSAERGVTWLVEAVESNRHRETSPIGFYFAKLWYYERLYPLIFTVSALGHALRRWSA